MARPIWQWSAADTAAAIRDGRATSEEVVQAHIDRMHSANPAINADRPRKEEELDTPLPFTPDLGRTGCPTYGP